MQRLLFAFLLGGILGGTAAYLFTPSAQELVSLRMENERLKDQLGAIPKDMLSSYRGPTGMEGIDCETGETATIAFDQTNTSLTIPCGIDVTLGHESQRRGTFVTYDFLPIGEETLPRLSEIQFFSPDSIASFEQYCLVQSFPCFFGEHFSTEEYDNLKKAYEDVSDWKERHMFVFNDHNFLVKNIPCEGDSCAIREYIWFDDNTMIAVWVMMESLDQQEEADAVFGQVIVE